MAFRMLHVEGLTMPDRDPGRAERLDGGQGHQAETMSKLAMVPRPEVLVRELECAIGSN